MKRHFFIFFAAIFLVCACGVDGFAWCRSDPEETSTEEKFRLTVKRSVDNSDFVFAGEVVAAEAGRISFQIAKSWKGGATGKTTFVSYSHYLPPSVVRSDSREYFVDSLLYRFELGKSYLVYGRVTLNGLVASRCGRTGILEKAQRDLDELNRQAQ